MRDSLDDHARPDLGSVVTVDGVVPAADLGIALVHEHLMAVHQGPLVDTTDEGSAWEEMVRAARYGVRSVVDLTNVGLGRDPIAVRRIARRSGVQVILGTGFYKDGWLPGWVHDLDVGAMADLMTREILDGVEGSGIRCGIIGEVGVSRSITPTEERSLAAAARTQRRTGAAINVHFDIGALAAEYHHAIDILEQEGADLARVVIDHFVCRPDEVPLAREISQRGPYIEFDLWGMETWPKIFELTGGTPPEVQIASLAWFVAAGLRDRILVSHDVANIVNQRRHGGYGQSHIVRTLWDRFVAYGITDQDLRAIMVDSPARLLPLREVVTA